MHVAEQAFALYLDAGLVAIVALLAVIVLGDSMIQWYGYVVLKRPFTSSEVVVMAGGGSPGELQTTIRQMRSSDCGCPAGGAASRWWPVDRAVSDTAVAIGDWRKKRRSMAEQFSFDVVS